MEKMITIEEKDQEQRESRNPVFFTCLLGKPVISFELVTCTKEFTEVRIKSSENINKDVNFELFIDYMLDFISQKNLGIKKFIVDLERTDNNLFESLKRKLFLDSEMNIIACTEGVDGVYYSYPNPFYEKEGKIKEKVDKI
jgi:hypothetical protein